MADEGEGLAQRVFPERPSIPDPLKEGLPMWRGLLAPLVWRSPMVTPARGPEDFVPVMPGWLRTTSVSPGRYRNIEAGPGQWKPGAEPTYSGTITGQPGESAYIDYVQGLRRPEAGGPLKGPGQWAEAKALAQELVDYLKSLGHTGMKFYPIESEGGAGTQEARLRLFEYILGQKARPIPVPKGAGQQYEIPFGGAR